MKRSTTRQSVVNTRVADHFPEVGGSRLRNLSYSNNLPPLPRQRKPLSMGEQAAREFARRQTMTAGFYHTGED